MAVGGMMRNAALATALLVSAAFGAVALKAPVYEAIAPGVAYARVEDDSPPLVFHVVKVDLRKRKDGTTIGLEAIKGKGGQTVAEIANALVKEHKPLLVAINGDFFERDGANVLPWGIHAHEGTLQHSPTGKSAFMLDAQGKPLIGNPALKIAAKFPASAGGVRTILAVNRARTPGEDGMFLYTAAWGPTLAEFQGGAVVVLSGGALELGKTVKCTVEEIRSSSTPTAIAADGMLLTCRNKEIETFRRLGVKAEVQIKAEVTPAVSEAIGGGPRIVRAGKPSVEFKDENFPRLQVTTLNNQEHPRSAVGYNQSRTVLILLIVEGRTAASNGVTMSALAQLMVLLGASDAMNLDGGGSATLYVAGRMVTQGGATGATAQRQVGNALGVFYRGKAGEE